jgi:hypothetical protein
VPYKAAVIIKVIKGVDEEEGADEKEDAGEKKGAGEEVTILLISLSSPSLRLIRYIFDRCRAGAVVLLPLLLEILYNYFISK